MSDEEIDIFLPGGRRRRGRGDDDCEPPERPRPPRPRPKRRGRKDVAPQVTDAVTTASVQVEAAAPAVALGEDFLATCQALALAAQQASSQQASASTLLQAATTQGAALILQSVPREKPRGSSVSSSPEPAKRG